jgi:translation elongation factor EF-4
MTPGNALIANHRPASPNMPVIQVIRKLRSIAHIDHGKSTLADRISSSPARLHRPGEAGSPRQDGLERERGITHR